MTNPSSLNIASPALISSALGAVTPFLGVAPGIAPTIPAAATFLRLPTAAQTIHDHFKQPADQYASFAMARFFEQLSGPPPSVADPWMRVLDRWEHASLKSFRKPLEALANIIEQDAADASADQMIDGLMAYLENGVEGKGGSNSRAVDADIKAVLGGLAVYLISGEERNSLHKALSRCANKWVLVCGFVPKNFEALGMDGMRRLYDRIIEKHHALKMLGICNGVIFSSIHRHSVDTMRYLVEHYSMTITNVAILSRNPRGKAFKIQEAYEAALETALGHQDEAVRNNALTIACAVVNGAILGKDAGQAFAKAVIEAYQSALETALGHQDEAVIKNAPTIAYAAAHKGIQGMNAGQAFAKAVIEAYQSALETALGHQDEAVKNNAPTIAFATAHKGIQGRNAGQAVAKAVIEAYQSALETALGHQDEAVRKSAPTIAHAAADRGIQGAEAGRKFVERWARGEVSEGDVEQPEGIDYDDAERE